jgi:hypothetical protein
MDVIIALSSGNIPSCHSILVGGGSFGGVVSEFTTGKMD